MENVINFKILISAPSDVKKEKKYAKEVIEDLNIMLEGISIELIGFDISTYSSASGKDGQDILNTEFGDDFEIFIGILWKKFGTATKRDDSGTLEEFHRAYNRFKKNENLMKIGFYFNTKITNSNDIDVLELKKINEFKNKFKLNEYALIYKEYNNYKHFRRLFRQNIAIFVTQLSKYKKAIIEYINIDEKVKKEIEEFLINASKMYDFNFDFGFENPNVKIKSIENYILKLKNIANTLEIATEDFDNLMKKCLNNIANIIIYFNSLKNPELKIEVFQNLKDSIPKLLQNYQLYVKLFQEQYLKFSELGNNYIYLKSSLNKYLKIIQDLIDNFTSYNIILQTYYDFIDKILIIDLNLNTSNL